MVSVFGILSLQEAFSGTETILSSGSLCKPYVSSLVLQLLVWHLYCVGSGTAPKVFMSWGPGGTGGAVAGCLCG